MRHEIRHDLSDELAKKAALAAGDAYTERFAKYNPSIQWRDERHAELQFSAKGVTIKGEMALEPGVVVVDMKVPFLLKPFASKGVEVVEQHFRQWAEKAKSGEL